MSDCFIDFGIIAAIYNRLDWPEIDICPPQAGEDEWLKQGRSALDKLAKLTYFLTSQFYDLRL